MCNTAIYKLYYVILFFSLSEHKANTTELHPKVIVRYVSFHQNVTISHVVTILWSVTASPHSALHCYDHTS